MNATSDAAGLPLSATATIATPFRGFVRLMRGDATEELLQDMTAFQLLTQIALRARYSDEPNLTGLKAGQAMIGDHAALGMSRAAYRGAIARLERCGLVSFKGIRSTKRGARGTIATLLDERVFSISRPDLTKTNHEKAIKQPSNSHHDSHQNNHHYSEVNPEKSAITIAITAATEKPRISHETATKKKGIREEDKKGESSPSPLNLTASDHQTISERLRISPAVLPAALAAFANYKRNHPGDAIDADAIVHWFRYRAPGKEWIAENISARGAQIAPSANGLPEPDGWKDWVRENVKDASHADKPWDSLYREAQLFIIKGMKGTGWTVP